MHWSTGCYYVMFAGYVVLIIVLDLTALMKGVSLKFIVVTDGDLCSVLYKYVDR